MCRKQRIVLSCCMTCVQNWDGTHNLQIKFNLYPRIICKWYHIGFRPYKCVAASQQLDEIRFLNQPCRRCQDCQDDIRDNLPMQRVRESNTFKQTCRLCLERWEAAEYDAHLARHFDMGLDLDDNALLQERVRTETPSTSKRKKSIILGKHEYRKNSAGQLEEVRPRRLKRLAGL
jgi:hypothetical protein